MNRTSTDPADLSGLAGATVALVAPSGYVADPAAVERGIARLRSYGCHVRNHYDAAGVYQRFGGTDAARAAQLHGAAADPEVDIVLALRGGYGMSRLLPALDLDILAASGKLFVGHSDFTALQMALLARAGTVTFAGPMVNSDFAREEVSGFTIHDFGGCIRNPSHTVMLQGGPHPRADVSGILWGGNLTMLAHLAGTPYLPRIDGGILFLEDINETPYRIERMLLQLLHAGALNQQAIVFGDFSGYRLSEYDNGYDFNAMLDYLRGVLGIPLFTGLPFGHVPDKVTLAVGSLARLQSDGEICTLTMSAYPILRARGRPH